MAKGKKTTEDGDGKRKSKRPRQDDPGTPLPVGVNDRSDVVALKYSGLRVDQLKDLLKARNASLRGKKKDLLDRLVFYDLNANFKLHPAAQEECEDSNSLRIPSQDKFKDMHADSPIPPFTDQDIELYLQRFQKKSDKAEAMYKSGYLHYARYCVEGDSCFILGQVSAEMRKALRYQTSAKLNRTHGEIEGASCECTAGHIGEAHCKHVIILFLAVADLKKKGIYTTEVSCTSQLQTFHRPKGKFKGTPMKCSSMAKKAKKSRVEENRDEGKDEGYRAFFRNHLMNGQRGSTMPIKFIIEPANPFAVVNDHTYSKISPTDAIIKALQLEEISLEEVQRIQEETIEQADSEVWHRRREGRVTASKFFHFIRGTNKALNAQSSLYPKKFCSAATNHGVKYEPVAVKDYVAKYSITEEVKNCGLFILESHPFIAGSPDRLLGDDGVVEVKCPYATRNREVSPSHQSCLENSVDSEKDTFKMNVNHPYWYQVQGQLLVTGRFFCDFVVWTFKGVERVRVFRAESFISLMLFDLCDYYFKYMKPAVLNKYFYRDYDKCQFHDMGDCRKD